MWKGTGRARGGVGRGPPGGVCGYRAYEDFDFYEITGDMVNWLAKIKVPAISVLLANHQDTEWTKNQAGIKALLEYYAK